MTKIVTKYVECIIYRKTHEGIKYLLLKRSNYTNIYPGIWQIVTGTLKGKESAASCAIREIKEETGIEIKRFFAFPKVSQFYTLKNDLVNIIPMFIAETNNENIRISNEHTKFLWLNYEDAYKKLFLVTQKEMLQQVNNFLKNKEYFKTLTEIIL
ncbi:MAG: NUDIX domain-containing protein [Ignavibacteria bacterium]|nr:NUDIX domain-containing protein [Ignavibacteria bacterium]